MRLERSRTDAWLFGICGGIARSMNADAAWIRVGFAAGAIFTGGVLALIYVAMAMLLPAETAQPEGGYWYVPSSRAYGFGGSEAPTVGDTSWSREKDVLAQEIRELRSRLQQYEKSE